MSKAVVLINGMRCRYCGKKATAADHIVPSRFGGTDAASNLTAACRSCNGRKSAARLPLDIEKELLTEAWIMAPDVERLADQFRLAFNVAARRDPIILKRDPSSRWKLI
jgi:hypothetical protein